MPATVPTADEFNALEARVAALEAGAVKPPDPIDPPDPVHDTPSPDGAEATAPGVVLVSAGLHGLELVALADANSNYAIAVDGLRDPVTHDVVRLFAMGGVISQETKSGHWYAFDDAGGWNVGADPTKPPPEPIDPGVPPDPPAIGQFVALYTTGRGSSGTWNWGTGNDDELCDAIEAVESEIGCQVQGYGFFSMYGSMNDWPGNYGWAVSCMINSRLGSRLRVPVIGVFPYWSSVDPEYYGWNDDRGLSDAANGRWDEMYRSLARSVHDAGAETAIWRLGYENNFNFMCAAPNWSQESETLWARAFDRMSSCIRDESAKTGLTSLIAFNPTCGRGSHSLEYMTPSSSAFDIYAADFYNGVYPDNEADMYDDAKRREFWATMWLGTDHIIEYALSYGKPMMLPETGAGDRPDGHGKHDSANFWHFEAIDVCEKARNMGLSFWGPMLWDVSPGDGQFRWSNNVQPACQAAIREHVADGTLLGNMGGAPAVTSASRKIKYPDWATVTKESRAWIDAHPDFVALRRKAAEDLVERARVVRPRRDA